jgi:restriction system protein
MPSAWMVRSGRASERIEEFVRLGLVAVGGKELGPLAPTTKKGDVLKLLAEKHADWKEGKRAGWASQFVRFLSEMKTGDVVVTFDRERRLYFIGALTSGYEWAPDLVADMPHVRRVGWTHQALRDLLSASSRNSLGAIQSLFKLSTEVVRDLQAHQTPIGTKPEVPAGPVAAAAADSDVEEIDLLEEVFEKSDEFIEDAINRLDWSQMQDLVAGILRAMGYRTAVARGGSDRGVDIFASPDGLGLQEPRIFVEVKHRTNDSMGAKEMRAFLGGRKKGDKCLYVSTGGFTKDAHYEADRADVPTTLINLAKLRELLIEHYEALDAQTRALVPLRRLYWPIQ